MSADPLAAEKEKAARLTDYAITEAMVRYGGSFVRGLGELFRKADDDNRRRLREAFPEYWNTYRELAELKAMR